MSRRETFHKALDGHTHHVLSLCWTRDGRNIASGSADKTIKIWDVDSGAQQRTIGGFPDEVTAVCFIPEKPEVASACADGNIRFHNWTNGSMARQSSSGDLLYALQLTPDASQALTAGQQGIVHRWNTGDGKLIDQWR